jgi:hypothetical protein
MFAIRSAKHILPVESLKALYYFLSNTLLCGIHIWGSAPVSNINALIFKQKSAIRIIYEPKYILLFKNHKIWSLNDFITYFKLIFMLDYKHGNLPITFDDMWETILNYVI